MSEHPVAHATFSLERTYPAAPARVCLARTSGRWAVTHEHASAPIDPAKL